MLQKMDGVIHPTAVGYTLRRLAAECANRHVIDRRSSELNPIQVGVGVSGGVEAAVHSIHRFVDNMPDDHIFLKLDFVNAFNSVRRDTSLESTANNIPELYKFVFASHSCEANLLFGEHIVLSREGSQQGDPLSEVAFCDAIHPTLLSCNTRTKLAYMNDVKLECQVRIVAADAQKIINAYSKTGLRLNPSKCEIVRSNFDVIKNNPVLDGFKKVEKEDLNLLGSPVIKVQRSIKHWTTR